MAADEALEPTLLGAIRKYWALVLVTTIVGAAVGIFVLKERASWVAESSILLENPQLSQLLDREPSSSPQRYVADQVAVLDSAAIRQRALEIAEQTTADGSIRISDTMNAAEVTSTPQSGLIEVVATHENAELAVAVANAIPAAYEEYREQETSKAVASAVSEFEAAIARVDTELESISERIAQIRAESDADDVEARLESAVDELLVLLSEDDATQERDAAIRRVQTLQLIASIQTGDPRLTQLNESREQALERRAQLTERRDELMVEASLTSTGIVLFSPAVDAQPAIGTARSTAIGVLAGFVLGTGFAFALSVRSRRFASRTEPESILNAPVLAEIPKFGDELRSTALPTRDADTSEAAESFRFAATALIRRLDREISAVPAGAAGPARHGTAVAIVSPLTEDGRSVVAANLAVAVAVLGLRVVVVDCAFANLAVTKIFNASLDHVGMTDVVHDSYTFPSAVQTISLPQARSLDLVSRGTYRITAPTFFRGQGIGQFLDSLRSEYDLVIADVPSVLEVNHAGSVLGLIENTILVVRHQSHAWRLAETLERISLSNSEVVGYLYNRADVSWEVAPQIEASVPSP